MKTLFRYTTFLLLFTLCLGCEHAIRTLTIDYSETIEQAIIDAHIDVPDLHVTSGAFHKTEKETGKKFFESRIYTYDKSVSAEFVKADMQDDGFRAATLYELLAYVNAFPAEQNENLIELGTVWKHGENVCDVVALKLNMDGRIMKLFNHQIRKGTESNVIGTDPEDGLFISRSWFLGLKESTPPETEPLKKKR